MRRYLLLVTFLSGLVLSSYAAPIPKAKERVAAEKVVAQDATGNWESNENLLWFGKVGKNGIGRFSSEWNGLPYVGTWHKGGRGLFVHEQRVQSDHTLTAMVTFKGQIGKDGRLRIWNAVYERVKKKK